MQIHEITVSAGRTFNHPYEDYSNLKPHIRQQERLQSLREKSKQLNLIGSGS